MKNIILLSLALLLSSYICATNSFAQKVDKTVGSINIRYDDKDFLVPVIREPRYIRYEYSVNITQSHSTCEFLFQIAAVEKITGALVIFHIGTFDGKKSSSFNKKIELKKGETKTFRLRSKLRCLNPMYFSGTATYENEN